MLTKILISIYIQSKAKIMLIDWESNNCKDFNEQTDEINKISAWRVIMLSNEFREGVLETSLNQFIITILTNLILIGFNTINLSIINSSYSVQGSQTLRFYLIFLLNFALGLIFYIWDFMRGFFFGRNYETIMDLLSVTNISLLFEI